MTAFVEEGHWVRGRHAQGASEAEKAALVESCWGAKQDRTKHLIKKEKGI